MLKSREFEHGISEHSVKEGDSIVFTRDQREDYTYSSADDLLSNTNDLKEIIEHFLSVQVPRLQVLESYDTGENAGIVTRINRKDKNRADYRARHNFGGYISQFQNGYMFGVPVKVEHDDDDIKEVIDSIAYINDIDSLNIELGYDCSRFGRAYEIHYRNRLDEDRVALSSVYETFMIYDASVEQNPICAVRCPVLRKGQEENIQVTVYTSDLIVKYKPCSKGNIRLIEEIREPNPHKTIPIVEWRNNRHRLGDYERVISLIDLYDAAQSDTANYMHDLNDAMLVISGDMNSDKFTTDDLIKMKEANLLLLEGGQDISGRATPLTADYLYKKYDVAGKEAYNKRIQDDIHKFTNTPDLTDDSFAGTQSGVAIKYKLFGLEQIRSVKERYYTKALRERYRIISNLHNQISAQDLDPANLRIIFTENIPEDEWSEIQSFYNVGGELSQRTLLERLAFITSAEDEMEALKDENSPKNYDFENKLNEMIGNEN